MQLVEHTPAHIAGANIKALLLEAVLGVDNTGGFRRCVGEELAQHFVGQPFEGWNESGGVVDGGNGDGVDVINVFVLRCVLANAVG